MSQQYCKPIFELTDEEIGKQGEVLRLMGVSRDNFAKVFNELAERVIKLTD